MEMSRTVRASIYQPSENTRFAWFSSFTKTQWKNVSVLCSIYDLYQTKKGKKKKEQKGKRICGFA